MGVGGGEGNGRWGKMTNKDLGLKGEKEKWRKLHKSRLKGLKITFIFNYKLKSFPGSN